MKSRMGLTFTLLRERNDPAQILIKLALRNALLDCESVLDIGCGASPTMRQLGVPRVFGLEGYRPSFEEAKRRNTHDEIVFGDVRDLASFFKPRQFDACVALDLIEHLTKPQGLKLLAEMESIAKKKVVLFTPSGFLPQRHASRDDLEEHLSGWDASEMAGLGYRVEGFLGPRSLRGEYHVLNRRPRLFWSIVSLFGHIFGTHNQPEKAAAILCVKDLDRSG